MVLLLVGDLLSIIYISVCEIGMCSIHLHRSCSISHKVIAENGLHCLVHTDAPELKILKVYAIRQLCMYTGWMLPLSLREYAPGLCTSLATTIKPTITKDCY